MICQKQGADLPNNYIRISPAERNKGGGASDQLIIQPSDLRIVPAGTLALPLWPHLPLTTRVPSPNKVEPPRQAVPKAWIPKEFNGMRFFIVPIDERAAIPLTPL